ncbi:hypothetical protein S40288_02576 [Stachybotrys chartarum IBT 40288]|nr:hypothetical protein S40288_02576 [Stachybotrys chartarum IBT 40288]
MGLRQSVNSLRGAVFGQNHLYTTIPTGDDHRRRDRRRRHAGIRPGPVQRSNFYRISLAALVFVVLLYSLIVFSQTAASARCEDRAACSHASQHLWGQYSPFFPVPSEIDPRTPPGCELTFGLVLSRHGSRDPTARKTALYGQLLGRLRKSVTRFAPGFEFIRDYDYDLGADQLTLFGQEEMVRSGEAFYLRYRDLADRAEPFYRAAGSDRVVQSALNFSQGLGQARGRADSSPAKSILVLPEEPGFNNTLNHGGCPAFEGGPAADLRLRMQKTWKEAFAPSIAHRLNSRMPGANLTLDETIYMMDLCPFTTVASPNATSTDFCRLFSQEEWESYDYFETLDKWYGYGSGNPLGATQGVGYVNELIARLTGRPVDDDTSTNSTLDSSPETFPVDRALYADFSHDNDMSSIYAALGLYNATADLPAGRKLPPHDAHGFSAAWTVPFAGRMYVEKMTCGGGEEDEDEELVRVLVNDRVVPLQNCGADSLGRCRLGAFVESLSFARGGGLWHACFS